MPKRGKREPSFHFIAVKVTQNMTRLQTPVHCAMIPVTDRYETMTPYKLLLDDLNALGPDKFEIITVVTVHKDSKSSAFLKLLSLMPDAKPSSEDMEQRLTTLCNTGVLV